MIISRTPFRISLFGGGTDYPRWYQENGGAVINTTVDKYCFITVRYLPPFFDYKYRIRYHEKEEVNEIDDIKHLSVRECLRKMKIRRGVEIVHHADLPAQSGMGSSSTFTVGLLHSLFTIKHEMPTKRELAINAIEVEQGCIHENVGSQDQTAAAFGGFNLIQFGGSDEIKVRPLAISPSRTKNLQKHMMLFFTGFARNASEIAGEQINRIEQKRSELMNMRQLVDEAVSLLMAKHNHFEEIGKLLHEQWMIKRQMTSLITNSCIDTIYQNGIKAGAMGGKLLGAGGGGFILFLVAPEKQQHVKEALKDLLHVPFRFENLGSQIIYYSHDV